MAIAIALVLFSGCASAPKGLTQSEAVQLAETFIIENGYTDLPATTGKLVPESLQFEWDNKDAVVQDRHDMLERKAVDSGGGKDTGWSVVFRYAHNPDKNRGRVVTLNSDGSNIRIQHQDVIWGR